MGRYRDCEEEQLLTHKAKSEKEKAWKAASPVNGTSSRARTQTPHPMKRARAPPWSNRAGCLWSDTSRPPLLAPIFDMVTPVTRRETTAPPRLRAPTSDTTPRMLRRPGRTPGHFQARIRGTRGRRCPGRTRRRWWIIGGVWERVINDWGSD